MCRLLRPLPPEARQGEKPFFGRGLRGGERGPGASCSDMFLARQRPAPHNRSRQASRGKWGRGLIVRGTCCVAVIVALVAPLPVPRPISLKVAPGNSFCFALLSVAPPGSLVYRSLSLCISRVALLSSALLPSFLPSNAVAAAPAFMWWPPRRGCGSGSEASAGVG